MDGAVAAILTVLPRLCVELWDRVRSGDHVAARALHERILPVWRAIEAPDLPARVKSALEMMARPVGPARSPIQPVRPDVRAQIRAALEAARVV